MFDFKRFLLTNFLNRGNTHFSDATDRGDTLSIRNFCQTYTLRDIDNIQASCNKYINQDCLQEELRAFDERRHPNTPRHGKWGIVAKDKLSYGYQFLKPRGQWLFSSPLTLALRQLDINPNTRKAMIQMDVAQEELTCLSSVVFYISGSEMHSTFVFRSLDAFNGFPYDIPIFHNKVFSEAVLRYNTMYAAKLSIGTMTIFVHDFHIYQADIPEIIALP